MKVVNPSYEVLDHLDNKSLLERIEYCGRICYKSEDKITKDSALPFFKRIARSGHNSVLEMGVLTLTIECRELEYRDWFLRMVPKYLHIDMLLDGMLITGSVRAFREMLLFHPEDLIVKVISNYLQKRYPWFFVGIDQEILHYPGDGEIIYVSEIDLEHVYQWFPEYIAKHRHIAVKFVVNRAISHEIVRHRPCSFLQECIAGDEIVQSYDGHKKWTMERLYEIFQDKRCGLARKAIRVRTMDSDGEIVPSRIVSVTKSGVKKLFKVTTKSGRALKTSNEHIFFTEYGETRLKDLKPGDFIYVNGKTVDPEWLRQQYLIENRERKDIAKELSMSDSWLGKVIKKYSLQKPKSQYPGRVAGYGVKGMFTEEHKRKISERMKGPNNPRWVGDNIKNGNARAITLYSIKGKRCICGAKATERHHIDRNPHNNRVDNIEFCCTKCHKAKHYTGVRLAFLDEIISIEEEQEGMTYDIEVDHPAHNFVVNGIIVHNSQRYCNYSNNKFGGEVEFVKPMFFENDEYAYAIWKNQMLEAESAYMCLLDNGHSLQAARTVLPNSCKTELIVYCNLAEWKHIFRLRTSKAAEPSMREVMIPLQEEFKQRWPEVF